MIQKNFENAKVLIVGGAGFVGSNLAHKLIETGLSELWIVDNLISSETKNIPNSDRVKFIYGSINDRANLDSLPTDLDYVFHLACYHGNQSSIANPFADHENNTLSSLSLFNELEKQTQLRKVVYAAAACAVAEKTYDKATETTEDQPVSLYHDSPYSISKIIGELYGNYFWKQNGLPFVKARFSNVYGPREILGAGQWRGTANTVWRNVIPTFIWRSLHGQALHLDNGGSTSRDFIFVEDMVEGLICCALQGEPGEVYNLATGVETTIKSVAEMINNITGNGTPSTIGPARPWDKSGNRFASTSKSRDKLGFAATVDMYEGLEKTINWTTENKEYIQDQINKHSIMIS